MGGKSKEAWDLAHRIGHTVLGTPVAVPGPLAHEGLSAAKHVFVIAKKKSTLQHRDNHTRPVSALSRGITPSLSHLAVPFAPPHSPMAANMRSFTSAKLVSQMQLGARNSYATQGLSIASRARWTPRPAFHQIAARQSIRHQSSSAGTGAEIPTPSPQKPRKRFSVLRWTWRAMYLSAIAGVGYVGYSIYDMRNPEDQPEPSPDKKTLVILGMSPLF